MAIKAKVADNEHRVKLALHVVFITVSVMLAITAIVCHFCPALSVAIPSFPPVAQECADWFIEHL